MTRYLSLIATTCLIGAGVWIGLLILTTFHGLLGEVNEAAFRFLAIGSRVMGVIAGGFWAVRRVRGRPVHWFEQVLLAFACAALLYFGCLSLLK